MRNLFSIASKRSLTPLLAALVLAGCVSAPAVDPATLPTAPPAFKTTQSAPVEGHWAAVAPADAADRGAWWTVFADPLLNQLIARSQAQNTDLKIAAARLQQARAGLRTADAQRLPQLGASAGVSRATDTTAGVQPYPVYNQGTAGANLAWELDLFGKLGLGSQAAELDAQASEATLRSTQLLVQAQVAQTYFALREADVERRLVRESVDAYRNTLKLTERRRAAGDLAELDVERIRTEVAATESDAIALDRQRAALENALAVLLGESASEFTLPDTAWAAAPPTVPAGLPSAVLARRPDVAAAQRGLMAAQARLGVAQSAWLPDLTLTATGGSASSELSDVFRWSARAWSVGTLLSLPIFDGGRRQANEDRIAADAQIALQSYRGQVLTALREVEDQLTSLELLQAQSTVLALAVKSATRATQLSDVRYRNGLVSQLDLLDARRNELRNLRQAVQIQGAQFQSTVALIRALGGGWEG